MKSLKIAAAAAAVVLLTSCSGAGAAPTASPAGKQAATTVESCGQRLSFTKAPQRVVMLDDTGASVLAELGLLDAVKFVAGNKELTHYDPATKAKLESIPKIKSSELATGGAQVATEVLLDARPDLVLGYPTGLDTAALNRAGIPVYSPAALCPDYSVKKADFGLITKELTNLGAIFQAQDKAKAAIAKVEVQIAKLKPSTPTGQSIAVLFVTPGSGTFYTYGTSSMVQPIVEANGLKNVYDQDTRRVFDASVEDLLSKNPDNLLILHDEGTPQAALATFEGFKGVDKMKAVAGGRIRVMSFALTDPPSMLSLRGAAELGKLLQR